MKRLVLLLLNLLMPMILFAASNDLCFRHFSVEDGLSSNSVRALMQDKYGFLWIGTDEGLNRYDGTTVKLYRLKDRGANEAISSLYSTLNKIWIGTDEGIYIYDYETEDIMPFVLATSKNIHIETNTNHIVEDKDKNLWFTTVGQGIFKYNTITNHLEQYEFKNANGLMASVLVDSENQIWAITNWGNSGLFKLNKAENKFETFPLSYESGKHDSNALVMLEDSEHTLWLGTWECGLQKIYKFSIVTCGLYSIYFWYVYVEDLNTIFYGDGEDSPNYIIVLLLSWVTCGIYGVYWRYKQANRMYRESYDRYGVMIEENGSAILLWTLLGYRTGGIGQLVADYFMIQNLNKTALVYNSRAY